jgi:hypothetical protein
MKHLNDWVSQARRCAFLPQLTLEESSSKLLPSPDAVRIAILDTGANFTSTTASLLYDSRVQQYVSWDSRHHPIVHESLGEDRDGHGTHSASMLLDSTQGTDCLILVAQVFNATGEKEGGPGPDVAIRIENVSEQSLYFTHANRSTGYHVRR